MAYFLHCIRCNRDGNYVGLDSNCPKCDGTGRDWRQDEELLDYHSWAGLQPHELLGRLNVKVSDPSRGDVWFFYRSKIYSVAEDKDEVETNLARLAEEFEFDYFTEPCQLCLERERDNTRKDNCGWCSDNGIADQFGQPGRLLRFEYDEGYQYYQFPHSERRFYLDGQELTERRGFAPVHPDCIRPDPRDLHRITTATMDLIKDKYDE